MARGTLPRATSPCDVGHNSGIVLDTTNGLAGEGEQVRAFIYCRISDKVNEDGASLDEQERQCREYAARQGMTVAAVYREIYDSEEIERPALRQLLNAAKRGEAQYIIVWKQDRLGRGNKAHEVVFYLCELAGLEPHCVLEPYGESSEALMTRGMKGIVSGEEKKNIKLRTQTGRRARAQSGRLIPGKKPLYGYQWRNGTGKGQEKIGYDPDPLAAPVVQRIYAEALTGKTLRVIADGLTADGIPTPAGAARWVVNTLSFILTNETYTGEAYAYGRWESRRVRLEDGTRAYRKFERPASERIRLPDGVVPALVSRADFDAVQERLGENRARAIRNNQHPELFLLRGHIRCGICHRAIPCQNTRAGSRGERVPRYLVRAQAATNKHVGCDNNTSILASKIDALVWEDVCQILLRPSLIEQRVAALRQDDDTTSDQLAAIDKALASIERQQKQLARAVAVLADDDASQPLLDQLRELGRQKKGHEDQRSEVEAQQAARNADQAAVTEIIRQMEQLRSGIVSANARASRRLVGLQQLRILRAMDFEEKRAVLRRLGVTVYLYHRKHNPDRYTFTTNLGGMVGDFASSSTRSTERNLLILSWNAGAVAQGGRQCCA